MTAFERHDFVTLRPDWRSHFAAPETKNAAQQFPDVAQQISDWQTAHRSFVVASRQHGDAPETLRLGLAGPGKTRLGFAVQQEVIATHGRPPLLGDIAAALPPDWQGLLNALAGIAATHGVTLRAFGSAAWAALTGLDYLTPTSDLDILIEPQPGARLAEALEAMAALSGPPRLDGEIRFRGLGDVNWREWLAAPERVLVRTRLGPKLIARTQIMGEAA